MPTDNAKKGFFYQVASTWIVRLAKIEKWFLYRVAAAIDSRTRSNLALPQTAIAVSETVSLKNGRVMFQLPVGFTEMTQDEIDLKFPRGGHQPQHVYANPERNVSIAITFSLTDVLPHQLPELQTVLRASLGKLILSIKWKREEITKINTIPWVHLEFVTQAIDTKIHNDTYYTSFDGKMLGFNFNSTVEQYEANRVALEKTRDSIMIRSRIKSTSPKTRLTRQRRPLQRSLKQLRLSSRSKHQSRFRD